MLLYCSNFDKAIQESFSMLIEEINKTIQTTRKGHAVDLIKTVIPITLLAYSTHSGMNENLLDSALYRQLASLIEVWITSKDMVGHPSFGGYEDAFFTSWKGMNELKVNKSN